MPAIRAESVFDVLKAVTSHKSDTSRMAYRVISPASLLLYKLVPVIISI